MTFRIDVSIVLDLLIEPVTTERASKSCLKVNILLEDYLGLTNRLIEVLENFITFGPLHRGREISKFHPRDCLGTINITSPRTTGGF